MKAVHEEVANGTFKPNRENDQLTQALGNKEHPCHTRGFGLIPWELSFPNDVSMYRSQMRRNTEKELEMQRLMEVVRQEMKENNQHFLQELEERMKNHPLAPDEDAAVRVMSQTKYGVAVEAHCLLSMTHVSHSPMIRSWSQYLATYTCRRSSIRPRWCKVLPILVAKQGMCCRTICCL